MKALKLPETDSIEELARFWDSHDLTDFEDQLEEVSEPVFERPRERVMVLRLHRKATTVHRKPTTANQMRKNRVTVPGSPARASNPGRGSISPRTRHRCWRRR